VVQPGFGAAHAMKQEWRYAAEKLSHSQKIMIGEVLMSSSFDLDKYVFKSDRVTPPDNIFGTAPNNPSILYINQNAESNFNIASWLITHPFTMEAETFYHDYDQFLYFSGSDPVNRADLGGTVELFLGDDTDKLEKLIITESTIIFVKARMLHCPLKFVEIHDESKPIIFQDITLSGLYSKFEPGSSQRLNVDGVPIDDNGNPIK
jgi:hypothetical protein